MLVVSRLGLKWTSSCLEALHLDLAVSVGGMIAGKIVQPTSVSREQASLLGA